MLDSQKTMNGYYSVFNPDKNKIADCGSERDALFLVHSRNSIWDGHYYQFNPLPGEIVDVNSQKKFRGNYQGPLYSQHPELNGWKKLVELPESSLQEILID